MVKKQTIMEKIYSFVIGFVLVLVGLSTLVPFLFVLSTSITPNVQILRHGMFLIPVKGISFDTYRYLLNASSGIPKAYLVTIFITVTGTILSLCFTSTMAYGISKRYLPGRNAISFFVLFTMLFGGGLIPTYVVVKYTGLIDRLWALIIPSLVSSWYVIVMVSFFESIPDSIEESARIDGCNDIVIFIKIIIPLSLPIIFTIALFYAVGYWNSWFSAIIYINDKSKWPLQVLLRQIISIMDYTQIDRNVFDAAPPASSSVKTSAIIVTTLPIIMVYPFIQKHFVKGIIIGAIKG